jgi:hypothetical protein
LAEFAERLECELEYVRQDHARSDHDVLVVVKTAHVTTAHAAKSLVVVILLKTRRTTHHVEPSKPQQKHHDQKRVHQRRAPWLKEFH